MLGIAMDMIEMKLCLPKDKVFLAAPPDQWMDTEVAMGIGQKARPGIIGRAPPVCVYDC